MKITLILILAAVLNVSARGYAQTDKTVNIALKNTAIENVLKTLSAQTGYEFIYNND